MLAIITDSTCDIPDNLIEKYGIIVVSHIIIWGEDQYRDRIDLQPDEFYHRLKQDSRRPTTSQAGVGDFLEAVNTAIQQGATQAVILTVSSAMSGAYDMATTAAEQAEIPVTVVDSKATLCLWAGRCWLQRAHGIREQICLKFLKKLNLFEKIWFKSLRWSHWNILRPAAGLVMPRNGWGQCCG